MKMEKLQPISVEEPKYNVNPPIKVKMKLIQPNIMCELRKEVECSYRGKIIHEEGDTQIIEFKYQGETIHAAYDKGIGFQLSHLKDIKIVE